MRVFKYVICALALALLCSCGAKREESIDEQTAVSAPPVQTVAPPVQPTTAPTAVPTELPAVTPSKTAEPKKERAGIKGRIICIDAGHAVTSIKKKEPVAPGSSEMKAGAVSGTSGKTMTEEQLNLKVALKLQKALEAAGADVVMTRTTSKADITNVDRAKIANDANADLAIRIHADGMENSGARGMSMLVPTGKYIKDEKLISKSRRAGEAVLAETVKATGAKNRGISERSDMTGFNWSEVPVILLEMGFMTNEEEDRLLSTDEYQDKIVSGIVNGLEKYFSE